MAVKEVLMARRPRHKFGAVRTEYQGRSYDSKREANYAAELETRKKAGLLLFWLEQVPFRLQGGVTYRVDFLEFHADGSCHFVEVKGVITPVWSMKMRMLKEAYPMVEIEVVK